MIYCIRKVGAWYCAVMIGIFAIFPLVATATICATPILLPINSTVAPIVLIALILRNVYILLKRFYTWLTRPTSYFMIAVTCIKGAILFVTRPTLRILCLTIEFFKKMLVGLYYHLMRWFSNAKDYIKFYTKTRKIQ